LFGRLLLKHRRAAGLTQEELATAAGVSARTLSNLERGHARAAQPRSAEALGDALGLTGEQRREFLAAARASRQQASGGPVTAGPVPGGVYAPPPLVPDFTGRDRELAQLLSWSRQADSSPGGETVAVVGPPGVGKTTLALAAARHLAARFPDGLLAIDLRGTDQHPVTASTALDRMLRALGVHPTQVPHMEAEQSSLCRSVLSDRRMLILLDNVTDEAHARPLLAAGRGCLTLITCRHALSGLEAARWLWLDPLPTHGAIELIAKITGPGRVEAEPQATRELLELCGNLPLAVRIAGNRLARHPHWSIASLAARLRDERTRLADLAAGDLQVRSAFAVSYHRLSPPGQRMFRRLALVPGADFGIELAAVAAGTGQPDARRDIEELLNATLIQAADAPDRYQFHDLIRLFARERLDAEESDAQRQRAGRAVDKHLLRAAAAAGLRLDPETGHQGDSDMDADQRAEATAWLDRESPNWLAALRHAASTGRHSEVVTLARAMHWYSDIRQQHPWVDVFGWGVAAAQALGDRQAEATLLNFLGWAQGYCHHDLDARLITHQQALVIAEEIGDRREQAWALGYLSAVLVQSGLAEEALDHVDRSNALFAEIGYQAALNSARHGRGRILRALGRRDEALTQHRAVLADLDRPAGQLPAEATRYHRAYTLSLIGEVMLDLQDWTGAAAMFHDARELISAAELPGLTGQAAFHEGVARRQADDLAAAAGCLRYALTVFSGAATRWWRARTLAELATTLDRIGAIDEAGRHRSRARDLCAELNTTQARALAAELSPEQPAR